MRFQKLSYQAQIFLSLLALLIVPFTLLGVATANRTAKQVNDQYEDALKTITNQIDLNVDTLLADAGKIGNLYLMNDDIRRVMLTNYEDSKFSMGQDYNMMRTQISQANRLNSNVISSVFLNKYGYAFEYNFNSSKALEKTLDNMEDWAALAREDSHYSYVGAIQPSKYSGSVKFVLPIVKILRDIYTNTEMGVFYVEVNFGAVTNILSTSKLPSSRVAFYGREHDLFFSTDERLSRGENRALQASLAEVAQLVDADTPNLSREVRAGGTKYFVNVVYNKSTGWRIVHFMDNSIITGAYRSNLHSFFLIFVIIILFGLLLAWLLARGLTRSIGQLCREIDDCEGGDIKSIALHGSLVNRDLQKVVDSYNRLNQRLTESLRQNYTIRLNEKLMRLRMLQSQLNPHFLYNTLNLIGSIANIHNLPQIKTIATSMSELLRYNLKSGPVVRLRDEITQVYKFIAIQQIRFPDKFVFECTFPPELSDLEIPTFILQPLVENAVGHGLDEIEQGGLVRVDAYTEGDSLHILVSDNGVGMTEERLEALRASLRTDTILEISTSTNTSIGVLSVHQRIITYYGRDYGLTVDSTHGRGTIVDIKLPLGQKPRLQEMDGLPGGN